MKAPENSVLMVNGHEGVGRELANIISNSGQVTAEVAALPRVPETLARIGKKSFLVFKHNKYLTVPTDTIAFFYIKYESTVIICFDRQEYSVNFSLEQIQLLLPDQQFFRLNRQYLINFDAVKEVEHYFARKLLIKPAVPFTQKLLVSKEKAKRFLNWLANR